MTMQKGICEECKQEYEYEYNPKYPRKYCPECSAKKKAEYEGKQNQKLDVPVVRPGEVKQEIVQASRHDVVISRTEKPHSYEFGQASARHKIYYGDVEELKNQIEALDNMGLIPAMPDVKNMLVN